jgi:flagellar hook protein FlgE
MTDAMNSAISGLSAGSQRQAVSANNLANALTPGFRASRVSQSDSAAGGTQVSGVSPAQAGGGYNFTGVPFDIAIDGTGYFALRGGAQNERFFSRVGAFGLDAGGFLADRTTGRRVMGTQQGGSLGDIEIPIGDTTANGVLNGFSIRGDGAVLGHFSGGATQEIGRIALARFQNEGGLVATGENAFVPSPNSGEAILGNAGVAPFGIVVQGALEGSNTDIAGEIVAQMVNRTVFKANLATIKTQKEMMDDLLNMA